MYKPNLKDPEQRDSEEHGLWDLKSIIPTRVRRVRYDLSEKEKARLITILKETPIGYRTLGFLHLLLSADRFSKREKWSDKVLEITRKVSVTHHNLNVTEIFLAKLCAIY